MTTIVAHGYGATLGEAEANARQNLSEAMGEARFQNAVGGLLGVLIGIYGMLVFRIAKNLLLRPLASALLIAAFQLLWLPLVEVIGHLLGSRIFPVVAGVASFAIAGMFFDVAVSSIEWIEAIALMRAYRVHNIAGRLLHLAMMIAICIIAYSTGLALSDIIAGALGAGAPALLLGQTALPPLQQAGTVVRHFLGLPWWMYVIAIIPAAIAFYVRFSTHPTVRFLSPFGGPRRQAA